MKIVSIVVLMLLFATQSTAGGGWPQPKGKGYVKLYEWFVLSNQYFNASGDIIKDVDRSIFNTGLYAEYGITDKLTIMANVPFSIATKKNIAGDTKSVTGLGDAEVGLTYGLSSGTINTSASIILGLPLGTDDGGLLHDIKTGDGEFNQMIRLDAGTSYTLFGNNAYTTLYGGYNNRTKNFSDEILFGIESGLSVLSNKLLLILRINGVLSADNGDNLKGYNAASLFSNNRESITYTPEINYFFSDNWGISLAAGGGFYARNILANPSLSIGVFSKF